MARATESTLFGVKEEEEISTKPRIDLAYEDWLTGYIVFLVRQSTNKDTEVILSFRLLM